MRVPCSRLTAPPRGEGSGLEFHLFLPYRCLLEARCHADQHSLALLLLYTRENRAVSVKAWRLQGRAPVQSIGLASITPSQTDSAVMASIPMTNGAPSWNAKSDMSVGIVPPKLLIAAADEGCGQGYHRYHSSNGSGFPPLDVVLYPSAE